ncbi:MAG: T9SS type A sorting domain-containing protein [Bacteroidota bacterium]
MKYLQIVIILLLMSTAAFAQVTKPVILFEDTSSSYITAGFFTEVDGQIEMVTQVRGFGIGYVVMDTTFEVLQEYIKPNYASMGLEDAFKLNDGGYLVTGTKTTLLQRSRSYNVSALRINASGDLVFQSILGDTTIRNFGGKSVIDQFGRVVVSGSSYKWGSGYTSISLTRFDSTGNLAAYDTYHYNNLNGVTSPSLHGMDIKELSDGNFVILASTNRMDDGLLVLFTTQQGDTLGTHLFGGKEDHAVNLATTSDGHFYVLSKDDDPNDYKKVASQVWKFTNMGELVWEKSYTYLDDQGINQNVVPLKLRTTSDGGCIVIGGAKGIAPTETLSSIHVAKFSSEGDMQWEIAITDSANQYPKDVLQLQDGSYILNAVYEKVIPQGLDIYNYYARLSPDGTHVATTSVQDEVGSLTVQVSPNPFTNQVEASFTLDQPGTYTARLYDLQGRVVQETAQQAAAGAQTVRMNTSNLAAGQYVLRIQARDSMWSGKVVKR